MKQQRFGRRATVVGAVSAVVLAVAGCGSSDGDEAASDEVLSRTVNVAVFPSLNGLDGYVADAEGFFEDEGLDVELVTAGAPSAMMPQLLGGSLDFALMEMVTPIVAKSEGVGIVAAAPGNEGTELAPGEMGVGNLWVRSDSAIDSVKELENSKFAIPQINSQVYIDVRESVDRAGGDSSKIKFVEAQDQLGALQAGDVDASTSSEPKGTAMLGEKSLKRLDNYITAGGGLGYMFMTTEKLAQQSPATLAAFERAILKANAFINANKERAAEIAGTYIDAPAELLQSAVYAQFSEEPITEEQIQFAIDRMVKYDVLDEAKAPKASDLIADVD